MNQTSMPFNSEWEFTHPYYYPEEVLFTLEGGEKPGTPQDIICCLLWHFAMTSGHYGHSMSRSGDSGVAVHVFEISGLMICCASWGDKLEFVLGTKV